MFDNHGVCDTRSIRNDKQIVIGGSMKEIMMEYGSAMVSVGGTVGFFLLMQELIWGPGALLAQLISLSITGGV